MMLYCCYQAFLFDLNLISLSNDDIPQHNACMTLTHFVVPCSVSLAGSASAPRALERTEKIH